MGGFDDLYGTILKVWPSFHERHKGLLKLSQTPPGRWYGSAKRSEDLQEVVLLRQSSVKVKIAVEPIIYVGKILFRIFGFSRFIISMRPLRGL